MVGYYSHFTDGVGEARRGWLCPGHTDCGTGPWPALRPHVAYDALTQDAQEMRGLGLGGARGSLQDMGPGIQHGGVPARAWRQDSRRLALPPWVAGMRELRRVLTLGKQAQAPVPISEPLFLVCAARGARGCDDSGPSLLPQARRAAGRTPGLRDAGWGRGSGRGGASGVSG